MDRYEPRSNLVFNSKFIQLIGTELEEGKGFIPLIGSGLSRMSGIMTGYEFNNYLTFVIIKLIDQHNIFSDDDFGLHENRKYYIDEDIVRYLWPNPPNKSEVKSTKIKVERVYKTLVEKYIAKSTEDPIFFQDIPQSPSIFEEDSLNVLFNDYSIVQKIKRKERDIKRKYEDIYTNEQIYKALYVPQKDYDLTDIKIANKYIVECAIRSLHDWRAMLQFICRLRFHENRFVIERQPNHFIIDSFNNFITKGKKPNLCHYLLAYLKTPLRTRRVLSTNFDTLFEECFYQSKSQINVFSVERNSSIPDPYSVYSGFSLIKLHGGMHETRSDYTLDMDPEEKDKISFLEYFYPPFANMYQLLGSNLIILGSSISDKRTVKLIEYVLEEKEDFKIFIVCFSQNSYTSIADKFRMRFQRRLIFTISDRLDLFLFNMYGQLTKSFPPGGFTYQFIQFVPPISRSSINSDTYKDFQFIDTEEKTYTDNFDASLNHINKIRRLYIESNVKSCEYQALLYQLDSRDKLWIELDNFSTVPNFIIELFKVIAIRVGSYNLDTAYLDIDDELLRAESNNRKLDGEPFISDQTKKCAIEGYIKDKIENFNIAPSDWAFYVNALNIPRYFSLWRSNKSLDQLPQGETIENFDEYYETLKLTLDCLEEEGFNIIYLYYSEESVKYYKRTFDVFYNSYATQYLNDRLAEKLEAQLILETPIDKNITWKKEFINNQKPSAKPDNSGRYIVHLEAKNIDEIGILGSWKSLRTNLYPIIRDKIQLKEPYHSYLKFCYSMTLFRESRHPSCFYYNFIYENTNDALQKLIVNPPLNKADSFERIVELLFESESFLKKNGGYAWMHRGTKVFLQNIFEQGIFFIGEEEKIISKSDWVKITVSNLSKYHFEISDWYLYAFYSTNNPEPLIESIFHKLESIKNIGFYKSQDTYEPLILLEAALLSIIKLIHISKNSLRYWMLGVQGEDVFDETKLADELVIRNTRENGTKGIKEWIIDYLEGRELNNKLKLTFSESMDQIRKTIINEFKQLRFELREEAGKPYIKYIEKSESEDTVNPIRTAIYDRIYTLDSDRRYKKFDRFIERLSKSNRYTRPFEGLSAWINSKHKTLNEDKTYAKSLRGGHLKALNISMKKLVRSISLVSQKEHERKLSIFRDKRVTILIERCDKLKRDIRACALVDTRFTGVAIGIIQSEIDNLSDIAIYLLRYSKSFDTQFEAQTEDQEYYSQYAKYVWQIVAIFSRLGLDLLHCVPLSNIQKEQIHRIRFLTAFAKTLAVCSSYDSSIAYFNMAYAITYNMPIKDNQSERALISLKKAECQISHAILLKKMICAEDKLSEDSLTNYRQHIAKMDDATISLNEAEYLLSGHSHSVARWNGVYINRLRVLSETLIIENESINRNSILYVMKQIHDPELYLFGLLKSGLSTSSGDIYRITSLLSIYCDAVINTANYFSIIFNINKRSYIQRLLGQAILHVFKSTSIDLLFRGDISTVNYSHLMKISTDKYYSDEDHKSFNEFKRNVLKKLNKAYNDSY